MGPKPTNLHRGCLRWLRWLSGGGIHARMSCLLGYKLPASVLGQNLGAAWEIVSAHIQGEQEASSGGKGFGQSGDVEGT